MPAPDGTGSHSLGWTGDRRHDSARANMRRRAAEDALLDELLLPHDAPPPRVGSDGQALLMKSLARLARQEDVDGAVAWSREPDGGIKVIAAQPADCASRIQPSQETYASLAQLERVQRLTDTGLATDLASLCAEGASAAAPIPGIGNAPAAIILLYPRKVGRPLRPRTIAILGEVAAKLSLSLSTSLAIERMGELDGAVRRLDRLASLGSLVSEIVHEIRNPLVSVKTFLQLLPDRLNDPAFHDEFRGVVSDEVSRLERMLNELLHHARPAPPTLAGDGARLSEAIETTLQLLTYRCREKGVTLETDIREELPLLDLSQDSLRQVFLNLLLNATDVTPRGGRIRISADWSTATPNHVCVIVEDEGPGIDVAARAQIFEPFWSTNSDRVGGLGLAICKRIIEESAGTIELDSPQAPGALHAAGASQAEDPLSAPAADASQTRGARFRIELPIAR